MSDKMWDWDVKEFECSHLPIKIGAIKNKTLFSTNNNIRILEMVIKRSGWGLLYFTSEIEQWMELIHKVYLYEASINANIDQYYMYITVDQKPVPPGKAQRRPGWHGDGFDDPKILESNGFVDNTYVCYDCLPTLFLNGNFGFPADLDINNHRLVLDHFGKMAEEIKSDVITYPAYNILKITPYCIHNVSFNESTNEIQRTFVKISFSKQRFNLIGNTKNIYIDYSDWEWKEPDQIRNVRYRTKSNKESDVIIK